MSKKYWRDKLETKYVRIIRIEGLIYYDELSKRVKKKRLKKKTNKIFNKNYEIYSQLIDYLYEKGEL